MYALLPAERRSDHERDIPGLVQTSLNLGILTTDEQCVQASFCVRSSVATQKEMLVARLRCLMAQLGGSVDVSGDYPLGNIARTLRCVSG